MRFFIAFVLAFIFQLFSAQNDADTKDIFKRIESQIVINPLKTRELLAFAKKNNHSKNIADKSDYFLVRSYFYENNYNEALKQIIDSKSLKDIKNILLYKNVLYDVGIKETYFTAGYESDNLYVLNEEILAANDFFLQGDYKRSFQKIINIYSKITNKNKDDLRESLSFLLTNMSEDDFLKENPKFLNPVLGLLSFYPNDIEFNIIKRKLLPDEITDSWLSQTKTIVDNTTNMKIQLLYNNLLLDYYFQQKDIPSYISASKRKDELSGIKNKEVIKARSQWIYLTENRNKNEYYFSEKKKYLILGTIILICSIVIAILIINIRYEKLVKIRYQLISSKIKTLSNRKKDPQIISEDVKINLLEKLERLESTRFYLDPNISIQTLAKKLDSNSKYVSDMINTYKKKNFTAYINELRIEYIKEKLNNDIIYRSYKIKYLAEESGFSSHSVFSTVFKNIEGISPVQYIQLLK